MLDTIQFALNKENFNHSQMLQLLQNKLELKRTTQYQNNYGCTSTNATYRNWNFNLSNNYLKGTGSLMKLHWGNCLMNTSFEHVKSSLDHLQSLFDIPIGNAVIRRLDVGNNISTNNPVSQYLKLLIPPHRFIDFKVADQTVDFRGKTYSLIFYDKIAEAIVNGSAPKELKNLHLLRYELRLKTPMLRQIGLPNLRLNDLYNKAIYQQLVAEWYNQYKLVPKLSLPQPPVVNFNSVLMFKDSMTLYAMHQLGGIDKMRSMLSNAAIKPKTRSDIRKALTRLDTVRQLSPALKEELDNKMASIYFSIVNN